MTSDLFRYIDAARSERHEAQRRAEDAWFMFERMFEAIDKGNLYNAARCSQSFLHNLGLSLVAVAATEAWLRKCKMPLEGPQQTTLGTEAQPSVLTSGGRREAATLIGDGESSRSVTPLPPGPQTEAALSSSYLPPVLRS